MIQLLHCQKKSTLGRVFSNKRVLKFCLVHAGRTLTELTGCHGKIRGCCERNFIGVGEEMQKYEIMIMEAYKWSDHWVASRQQPLWKEPPQGWTQTPNIWVNYNKKLLIKKLKEFWAKVFNFFFLVEFTILFWGNVLWRVCKVPWNYSHSSGCAVYPCQYFAVFPWRKCWNKWAYYWWSLVLWRDLGFRCTGE